MSPKRLAEYSGYCSGIGWANCQSKDDFQSFDELFPEGEDEEEEMSEQERDEDCVKKGLTLPD